MTRRTLLAAAAAIPRMARAAAPITRPEISAAVSPPEQVWVETPDGNQATSILRRPPGRGKFPAMIFLHGGLGTVPVNTLREWSLTAPTQCRALAAGWVVLIPTFRKRNEDPQSRAPLTDSLAMVRYAKKLPEVDQESVVVYGCSGGGSLALELAGEEPLAAAVAEEPATVLFTGMMNRSTPKAGAFYEPGDSAPISQDPKKYYTPELREFTRAKIRKIRCPILIAHGDRAAINRVNELIVIPELKAAGKDFRELSFPGEPHCFGFHGDRRLEAAARLFAEVRKYLELRLKTKPVPVDANLVRPVVVQPAQALLLDPWRADDFAACRAL